jgi:ArsR family transcriptional regulator, arsenate/arsenite/antimonite-responsive transcriptional repressor
MGALVAARRVEVIDPGEEVECYPSVLAAPLQPDQADALAKGFSALGDPVRLRVLSLLAAASDGEICVCNFVEPLGKSQGTISHHLRILSEAGLVHGDRRGKWVWYSLDRHRLAELRGAIDPSPLLPRSLNPGPNNTNRHSGNSWT